MTIRLKQLAPAGASDGDVPVWDSTAQAWVAGSVRMRETPSPSFGGAFPNLTYSFSGDEMVGINDPGGGSFTFSALSIASGAVKPEQRMGIRLRSDIATSSITINLGPSDSIVNPLTGTLNGPPGTPITFPPGTFDAGQSLVWHAVAGTLNQWAFDYDLSGPASAGSSLPVVGGTTSNPGNDLPAPTIAQRNVEQVSSGAPGWIDVGANLYQYLGFLSTQDSVIVEVMGSLKYTDTTSPAPGNTTVQSFRMVSDWNLSSGGDTESVLVAPQGTGAANIRFNVTPSGPTRELFVQVQDPANAALTVSCSLTFTLNGARGEIS